MTYTMSQETSRYGSSDRLDYLQDHRLVERFTRANLSNYTDLLAELLNCSMAYLSLIDRSRVHYPITSNFHGSALDWEHSPDTWVLEQRSYVSREDLKISFSGKKTPETGVVTWGWRGWAAVPLRSRENYILGTIGVADNSPRKFQEADCRCLFTVGWEIMNHFYRGELNDDTVEDVAVLKNDPEELSLFSDIDH